MKTQRNFVSDVEVEVANSRPHPVPLPQERGRDLRLQAIEQLLKKSVRFQFHRQRQCILPLLGERAGVRAVVRLTIFGYSSHDSDPRLITSSPTKQQQ